MELNIIHNHSQIIEFVNTYMQSTEPFFISRIGGSDYDVVCDYFNDPTIIDNEKWYRRAVNAVSELNGYFDFNNDQECFRQYLDVLTTSYKDSDVISYAGKQEKNIRFFLRKKSDIDIKFKPFLECISENKTLINWNHLIQEVTPFLTSFKTWGDNKKILFVSPFSKSIEHQFQFKDSLFLDYTYPNFILKTYNTPITYNNQNDSKDNLNVVTNNWHEECQRMATEISKIDFDIAFLSCGSYAMFLGHYIKNNLKKQALYFGGSLNLYFNIYGQRFANMYDQVGLNPDYLIDAIENKLVDSIAGGRTRDNEALLAYFGKRK